MANRANYSIDWNASISGVTGTGIGQFLVTGTSSYVPATTANYTASPRVRAIIIDAVGNNVGPIQYNGDVPGSITGITNTASGYARLNLTTGYAEWVATLGPTDIPLGVCIDAVLSLDFSGGVSSAYTPYILGTDYGMAESASDNGPFLQAALDAMEPGMVLKIPAGDYVFKTTAFALYESGFHGCTIEGESPNPNLGTSGVFFIWDGVRQNGTAASLTCVVQGAADATYTWTHFQYLRVSGCSGLTSALVGRQVLLGGAARSYWNVIGVCVSVESATSMIVAVPMVSTNVAVVTNTDANNGAITWEIYHPLLEIRSREVTVCGIQFATAGGSTRKPSALICWSQSDQGTVHTNLSIDRCQFSSTDGFVSLARAGIQMGRDVLPQAGFPYYLLEGGYRRPFVPYQGDFLRKWQCNFDGAECAVFSGNPTGQSRGNMSLSTGYGHLTDGFRLTSRFTNEAEQIANGTACAWDIYQPHGGDISNIFYHSRNAPVQTTIDGAYFESTLYKLARCFIGTSAPRSLVISRSYFVPSGTCTDGWIEWVDGPVRITDSTFLPVSPTGFKFSNLCSADGIFDIERCTLPDEADTGGTLYPFPGTPVRGKYRLRGNVSQTASTQAITPLRDRDVTTGYTTQGGQSLQKVTGLSGTWTEAVNFAKKVTVTGAATTGTWTFATNEPDTNYEVSVTPCGKSGAVAAGSNRVLGTSTKAVGSYIFNIEVAPGGATSVDFLCILTRPA